jgi:hypothetical protein
LKKNDNFGMRIEDLARRCFARYGRRAEKGGVVLSAKRRRFAKSRFILHNVDVISTIDLQHGKAHQEGKALATLAVQDRETSRYLVV